MITFSESHYTPEKIRKEMKHHKQSDGADVFSFSDQTGFRRTIIYRPFPGVAFIEKRVEMPQFINNWRYAPLNAITIEYCLEGKLEIQIEEEQLSISKGNIVIARTDLHRRILKYPNKNYHAISFAFYLEEPSSVLNMHLGMAGVTLEMLMQKYLPDRAYFHILENAESLDVMQEVELLKDLFDSIKNAPETVKNMYIGIKGLESLILLAARIDKKQSQKISKNQVKMVNQVYRYVMEHPEERYSIEELAEKFNISSTYLKQCFQMVYGTPMQKFIREQKMKAAAKVLATTNRNVTEVAQMFGYSNISKFSEAFKSVTGEPPKQYSMHYYAVEE